ncbi:hypothetical protein GCM10012280_57140 [Wenjunlia tyrosinilytica]|uniref:Uncharacterized protein n=1 Tax=Wenjunlia tyrosinilytica TaxID=1544741 RepID=A0A918E0D7_9ACTN|nr:hypothetical protein GCM10012280_57140 [Wenjunlia tyrosinilytica]
MVPVNVLTTVGSGSGLAAGQVVLREGVQGRTVRCGRRADLLQGMVGLKTSRWPFVMGASAGNRSKTLRIGLSPYIIALDATLSRFVC